MLNIKHIPVENINKNKTINARFVELKNQMDTKLASYLRYLGTKNAVNRASDYHYLCLAVTDSTAPVNGIDYIHPVVKPCVDYATAVIAKGLTPNSAYTSVINGNANQAAAEANAAGYNSVSDAAQAASNNISNSSSNKT